jgi:hypothetical protein
MTASVSANPTEAYITARRNSWPPMPSSVPMSKCAVIVAIRNIDNVQLAAKVPNSPVTRSVE